MKAPAWAHEMLDLLWAHVDKESEELYSYMPGGAIEIVQHPTAGRTFSGSFKGSRETFTVDIGYPFRPGSRHVWTVRIQQPQAEPVAPLVLTLDEWRNQ